MVEDFQYLEISERNVDKTLKKNLVIGALPLPAYPFVAFASVMSLSGISMDQGSAEMAIKGLMVAILFYPVVFFTCLILTQKVERSLALRISKIPVILLALMTFVFIGWALLDNFGNWKQFLFGPKVEEGYSIPPSPLD